jgi:protein TonB
VVQSTTIGDSLFINRVFKGNGHLWKQESFKDAEESVPHGQFAWYDDEGRIDSSGYVNNRKKTGIWSYYNDTLGVYLSIKYDNGREIERRDYANKIIKTTSGEKTFDDEKRERDTLSDRLSKRDEKEAAFKGGMEGYKKYLLKNMIAPNDLKKSGTVKLQFIINKIGKIENLLVLRSLQLTADIEALRVISESPDWTPAYQNGRNVIYQAVQYIGFQVN